MEIEVITDPKQARSVCRESRERSPVLAEVELHVFRGASLYVLRDRGVPVTYNVTRFGKRRKNVWEPYANWYTAYTVSTRRREGLATSLALHVKELAIDAGCRRLKALAGTRLGLLLHISLGDQLWGVTEKGEVVIDTALIDMKEYDNRTPPNAVKNAGVHPWTLEMVEKALEGRTMPYDPKPK